MRSASLVITCIALGLGLGLAACGGKENTASAAMTPPPISDCENGWECAHRETLPQRTPLELEDEGLHNVFELSENIISGAEPHGEEALKKLSEMGVKTILSVDGKTPDAETARKYGMRYVHVPIRYRGIEKDEIRKIAKTFREQQGPFYVHCFHGKHRGPAGAAIGRVVLDGVDRETALAEMAQWCGTAKKYEGLFKTIATADMPDAAETKALDWGFDEAHPFQGIRSGMIHLTRAFDNLKFLKKTEWQPNEEHPDLDATNEAEKVKQLFALVNASDELRSRPSDYKSWMADSTKHAGKLHQALYALNEGQAVAREAVDKHFEAIKDLCSTCHKAYRNDQ